MHESDLIGLKEGIFKDDDDDYRFVQLNLDTEWYWFNLRDQIWDIAQKSVPETREYIKQWMKVAPHQRKFDALKRILQTGNVDLSAYNMRKIRTADEAYERKGNKELAALQLLECFGEDYGLAYKVVQSYQLRVSNGERTIDVYPLSQKWFDLNTKRWGTYGDLTKHLMQVFALTKP